MIIILHAKKLKNLRKLTITDFRLLCSSIDTFISRQMFHDQLDLYTGLC